MLRKLVMYISAFLPILIILWVKEVLICISNILEKPCKFTWKSVYRSPYLIAEAILIILISLAIYWLLKRNDNTAVYTVIPISVKNRSAEYYLSYYSLFILAMIEFSLTNPIDLFVLLLLLVALGAVYIKNDLYFINPTINIFQSYIYEIEYKTEQYTITKLIISPTKFSAGDTIDIDISDFEFTFLRRKHEKRNHTEN